jgi:hypothetical protein
LVQISKSRVFLATGAASLIAAGLASSWALGLFSRAPDPAKTREQMIGRWELPMPEVQGKTTLDLFPDGKFTLFASAKTFAGALGNAGEVKGTWECLKVRRTRFILRLQYSSRPNPVDWEIDQIASDEIRAKDITLPGSVAWIYKRIH